MLARTLRNTTTPSLRPSQDERIGSVILSVAKNLGRGSAPIPTFDASETRTPHPRPFASLRVTKYRKHVHDRR
jgi:hypothetical protein